MAERDPSELELAAAFRAYLQDAPTHVRPTELARQFAIAYPHRRRTFGTWPFAAAPRLAWTLLVVGLLLAALVGGTLLVGSQLQRNLPAVVPPVASPAANPDEALAADLAAVWSNPYDAATVAALYAPNAVVYEIPADQTHKGLDVIGVRIRQLNAAGFTTVVTSAPIRQDDFVAVFAKYGTGADPSGRGLVVYELKDGKVLNQWVYPAP